MQPAAVGFIALLVCTPIGAVRVDEADSFFINTNPSDPPLHPDQCKALVKAEMAKDSFKSLGDNIGARIGSVLTAPFIDAEIGKMSQACCDGGTDYDNFVHERVLAGNPIEFNGLINSKTAVFVIDMQKDFTDGSLGQPCFGSGGKSFTSSMAAFIAEAAGKGALIVASKDFHPHVHCSFHGPGEKACKNTKDYVHEVTAASRYVNAFPAHCTWAADANDHFAVPQAAPDSPFCKSFEAIGQPGPPFCSDSSFIGAAFDDDIRAALTKVPANQLEVVFKGFREDYDSFSAMPHLSSRADSKFELLDREMQSTGGFALPRARDDACHGVWDDPNHPECYPTVAEMTGAHHTTGDLRSILHILKEREIDNIVVVGLVYDFCVKETAIFAKELFAERPVSVLAHLTRPSFDGRPGAPYTAAGCDGGLAEDDGFCTEGGGTRELFEKVLQDFSAIRVTAVRFEPKES